MTRQLLLNGFAVELPTEVEIVVRSMPNPADVKLERERLRGKWFVHWTNGELSCLRLEAGGPNVVGSPKTVSFNEQPWLFRARLDDAIETVFEKYSALRHRPFTFLAQREEVVAKAANAAAVDHPLLPTFKILPKFSLQAKIIEPRDDDIQLGLFVNLGMRHEINADLKDLQSAGVDITGLYAVRRKADPGMRRLVGRIDQFNGSIVRLSETSDAESIEASQVQLEGSLEGFARCLKTLLGKRYENLRRAIDDVEAGFRVGPEFDSIVTKMGEFLRKKSPIGLGQRVQAHIGKRLTIENDRDVTSVYVMPPIEYVFDRAGANRSKYAWPGLQKNGPFDRATFARKSPRILVLYPDTVEGKVEAFIRSLRDGVPPPQQQFPNGFAKTFGLINPDFLQCPIKLFSRGLQQPEEKYRRAAEAFLEKDSSIDAAIVVILDEHSQLPILQNPYVRTKSLFLTLGIPTQQIRLATINQQAVNLQYTLQNLSIALYAKLNGTPWTIDQDKAISDEIVIGMGIAELSGSRAIARQRFVGITTVFGGDGNYLLGNVSRECSFADYASALRESMVAILCDVRARNNWQAGDTVRVIFHAHKPLKRDEVASIAFDCAKQVGGDQHLQMAFVTVSHDHPFLLFDPLEKGVPVGRDSPVFKGVFAPARGTIARIGQWTRLVAINSHLLIKRANSPLPRPLLVNLHQDSTFLDLDYLAEQVVKFTSLSWRSTLPASTPVTIYYSERIAELLARLREVPDWSPTALAVKLRWSRWFL